MSTGKVLGTFFFIVAILGIACPAIGQDRDLDIYRLEASLDDLYGLEKLKALNTLTEYFLQQESRKALRYGKQAVFLAERMFGAGAQDAGGDDVAPATVAYLQLGQVQYDKGTFFEARRNFEESSILAEKISDQVAVALAHRYLFKIDSMVSEGSIKENFFSKNLGNLRIGKVVTDATEGATIEAEIVQAQSNENKGEFQKAIDHYSVAMDLLKNSGNAERINTLSLKVAALHDSLGQYNEAEEVLTDAIAEVQRQMEQIPRLHGDGKVSIQIPEVNHRRVTPETPPEDLRQEKTSLKAMADQLARDQQYEKSLEYYKMYQDLAQRMYEDSVRTELENENREVEMFLLDQQRQIAEFNRDRSEAERLKQMRQRNNFLYLAIGFLLFSGVVVYFYINKRREHGRLKQAYRDLDLTKTKLESAEQRIVRLLAQQVSGDVANELLAKDANMLGERRFVCIMFLDIRDFTQRAETMSPEDLILYQNNIFSQMIDTVQQRHGVINQLLGDGFMATFGAPVSHGNDCQNAFDAAKDILRELQDKVETGAIPPTKVGIGLHAGYVVTGNVGSEKRKQYSITGNAVIIASRVEQLNKTYKSQLIITEDVYNNLEQPLKLDQPFLDVTVRGRTQPVKILKIA